MHFLWRKQLAKILITRNHTSKASNTALPTIEFWVFVSIENFDTITKICNNGPNLAPKIYPNFYNDAGPGPNIGPIQKWDVLTKSILCHSNRHWSKHPTQPTRLNISTADPAGPYQKPHFCFCFFFFFFLGNTETPFANGEMWLMWDVGHVLQLHMTLPLLLWQKQQGTLLEGWHQLIQIELGGLSSIRWSWGSLKCLLPKRYSSSTRFPWENRQHLF